MVVKGRAMSGGVAVGVEEELGGWLESHPQSPCKNYGMVAGETEEFRHLGLLGRPPLAYLASFRPIRDLVSKTRWTRQG